MSKSAEHQQELDAQFEKERKEAKDQQCFNLIRDLINSARNDDMRLYRETKKEIKRLNLEDPEARAFFSATLGRIQTTKF